MEISPAMIAAAERNVEEYQLKNRVEYKLGSGDDMPFEDESFDGVFTNGSLHEWSDPMSTFSEIKRVLKPAGRLFVSDFKRNINIFVKAFLWLSVKPREIRPGLISSIHAAYTVEEIRDLLKEPRFAGWLVSENPIGLKITGAK